MIRSTRLLSGVFSLSTALVLGACAGEAESAPDDQTARLAAAQPAEATVPVEPSETAAPAAAEPAAAAAEPEPAREPVRSPAAASTRPRPTPRPAVSGGSSSPAPAEPARAAAFVDAGTSITATVSEELSTERTREGDRFQAALAEDVLGANGEVLLPAGAVLNGRVTTSHASTGPNDLAALEVEVESITADGRTLPVSADVVELAVDADARDSNTRSAAKVGAGAIAGAIAGRIIGSDRGDAAKGAAVGAAAGAAVAVATRSGNAVIKPGARMVVRLNERLIVSR